MSTVIKLRRDLLANWELADPILGEGEMVLVLGAGNETIGAKVGDGFTTFKNLPFYFDKTKQLQNEVVGYTVGATLSTSVVGAYANILCTTPNMSMDTTKYDYTVEIYSAARIDTNNNGVNLGIQYSLNDGAIWTNYQEWRHRGYGPASANSYPTMFESMPINTGFVVPQIKWRFTYGAYTAALVQMRYGSGGQGTAHIKVKEFIK